MSERDYKKIISFRTSLRYRHYWKNFMEVSIMLNTGIQLLS